MTGDTVLLIILAVGTIVLNKDIIRADWTSATKKVDEQS
jgi:hypothetical protein